jgi:hypothetical protein
MKRDATNAESSKDRHTRFSEWPGGLLNELDGSLLTDPTHLYPPVGGAGRRSPVRGIRPAEPFSARSEGLTIGRSATSKRVADLLVETLQTAGVKTCYGIPGDTLNRIAHAIFSATRFASPPSSILVVTVFQHGVISQL